TNNMQISQVIFVTTDLVYSTVQIIMREVWDFFHLSKKNKIQRIITHGAVFCLLTTGYGGQIVLCFYLAFYTMTFVLIDYSFLYRMWARNGYYHLPSMAGYFIYVSILVLSFGFMICASLRISIHLGGSTSISARTRNMQRQLFRMLCWQTIVPFIFLYTPSGFSLSLPAFGIDLSPLPDFVSLFLSFFLPFDALVVIYLMKDYREAVLSVICC
ncbi:hypothetical protein PFISCL1PPCAC_13063, partial [Pristionchus fissidentatus]